MEVIVAPELGAKIVSLRTFDTGREWMWWPTEGPHVRRVPVATPFPEGSLGGADECMPTIAPCRWQDRDLPDHGEVWPVAWKVDEGALAAGRIVTQVQCPVTPLRLQRTIATAGDSSFTFDYELVNPRAASIDYLWAFHPLLSVRLGDRIQLPDSCDAVRVESAIGLPELARGMQIDWPAPQGAQWDQLDLGGADRAVKVYTAPLTKRFCELRNDAAGERLRLEFDDSAGDTIGVWINRAVGVDTIMLRWSRPAARPTPSILP
jgi:hypothetical protein